MASQKNERQSRGVSKGQMQDIAGLVPDHRSKAGIAIKGVVIALLVKGRAFNL